MATYMPATIWMIGAIICYYIAKSRNVKLNVFRNLIIVIMGPLAIPLMLFVKPEKNIDAK